MIHLRTVTDESGDTIDLAWYCSQTCYADSLREDPPSDTFEQGGAYPCGSEHDVPDYCATCGDPVGNPLTDDGASYVREYVRSVLAPNPLGQGSCYPFANETAKQRAEALKAEYSYLFTEDESISARLEYLRGEIEAERISLAEIAELQGLAAHIESDDILLREWAGIAETEEA